MVLTNKYKKYGAACLLYGNSLDEIAEEMEADILIIPSSVHEVLLVKDKIGEKGCSELKKVIKNVNQTLFKDEILSDRIYKYEWMTKKIFII